MIAHCHAQSQYQNPSAGQRTEARTLRIGLIGACLAALSAFGCIEGAILADAGVDEAPDTSQPCEAPAQWLPQGVWHARAEDNDGAQLAILRLEGRPATEDSCAYTLLAHVGAWTVQGTMTFASREDGLFAHSEQQSSCSMWRQLEDAAEPDIVQPCATFAVLSGNYWVLSLRPGNPNEPKCSNAELYLQWSHDPHAPSQDVQVHVHDGEALCEHGMMEGVARQSGCLFSSARLMTTSTGEAQLERLHSLTLMPAE